MVAVVHALSMNAHKVGRGTRPATATALTNANVTFYGLANSTSYRIDWGEGVADTTASSNGSGVLTVAHAFKNAGKFTVTLRNSGNTATISQLDVFVGGAVSWSAPITHDVSETFTFSLQPSTSYDVDWGDDTAVTAITTPAGTDERQTITLTGYTGGTFIPTINGTATGAVGYAASVPAFQAIVDAQAALNGNVVVGGTAGAWTLDFVDDFANTNVSTTTLNTGGLTDPHATSVTTDTAGDLTHDEVQTVHVTGYVGGTFVPTINSVATAAIAYNASVAAFQAAVDATALVGDVTVGGTPGAWTLTYSGTLTHTNVPAATLNTAGLTAPSATVATNTSGVPTAVVTAAHTYDDAGDYTIEVSDPRYDETVVTQAITVV